MQTAHSMLPLSQEFQAEQVLILDQVDDAIALLNANQELVLFNQKLGQMWHLPVDWLSQRPTLSHILDRLEESGHWSQTQRHQVWEAYQSSSNEAVCISQGNSTHLELFVTATSNGGKLLIFRDLTLQRQYQEQLASEVQRLKFLLGLTERLQTSDNLEDIGRFALNYLVEAMGAAFGDVKVINGEGHQRWAGKLTNVISGQFIATYGTPVVVEMEAVLAQGVPYGQGLLWDVVTTGQPLFVEDYANHPKAVRGFQHPGIGQLGIFPIPSASGNIIGVLTLESRSLDKLQEAPQQDMLLAACRTLGAAIERAQSQDRLQRINQDLERASRLKSEFLASMSHELRTPLNSILGFSDLLLRQQNELGQRKTIQINAIQQSGKHLLALINDILDLSKIEAGKAEVDLQPVDIQALCRQCLSMIQPRADVKRLALSLELDYRLTQLNLDERRVRQMVINLLSNAVKFTPEQGSVKLAFRLNYGNQLIHETRPDDSTVNPSTPYLCIEVADTGIGIPTEKQALLFHPFQQIDSSLTRRHDGTGLGLALTKRLAELHGGTVSFSSVEGKGSQFRIWLPLQELRSDQKLSGIAQPLSVQERLSRRLVNPECGTNPRILVVEDHPYNQTLVADLLETEGFVMELISDGQTMLETIQSDLVTPSILPKIVLMDIQLPHIDGLELIRQMKAHALWSRVPVIALTAMAMAHDRDRCLAAGADDYLSKPLDADLLIKKIQQWLQYENSA
jgi:signal transduction histidine kinase/ActR/RegA family two-component response regulator